MAQSTRHPGAPETSRSAAFTSPTTRGRPGGGTVAPSATSVPQISAAAPETPAVEHGPVPRVLHEHAPLGWRLWAPPEAIALHLHPYTLLHTQSRMLAHADHQGHERLLRNKLEQTLREWSMNSLTFATKAA